jgi:ribosomal protein L7Ae-like RNA K-turn-binding protein
LGNWRKKINSNKPLTYLGFAARARKIQCGYNTVLQLVARRKAKLVIIAEDTGENTKKKITQKCGSAGVRSRIWGTASELSHAAGKDDKGVFAVTDEHFAEVITEEIDRIQSEGEGFNDKESI